MTTTSLSIPSIRRHLTASAIGHHLYLFGEVDSTNARLTESGPRRRPGGNGADGRGADGWSGPAREGLVFARAV